MAVIGYLANPNQFGDTTKWASTGNPGVDKQ
jgi:hypothetical protein